MSRERMRGAKTTRGCGLGYSGAMNLRWRRCSIGMTRGCSVMRRGC